MPFIGNVAYTVREHSFDNKITQLIRHTIEFIKQHKLGKGILYMDTETQNAVSEITQATQSYEYNQRTRVINENLKPFSHPYFSEYKELKKICMQILRFNGLKYGKEKDKVYGLLFDGAWLWEEYLNTILKKQGFHHPQNKDSKGAIYLFKNSKGLRYPDFWKSDFILDAKYKRLGNGEVDRHDMNQIISYMYVKQAQTGGFICPAENSAKPTERLFVGELNGYGGEVYIWTLAIPQKAGDFGEFCEVMSGNEREFISVL